MNKSKTLLKTDSRLGQLESMVVQPYSVIWDCCCDHGLLGMSLLKRKRAGEVIFVDVIAKQMEKLEKTLTQSCPRDEYSWRVYCEDLKNIVVPNRDSQLFIIAGVGSHQAIEFINSLCASAPSTSLDFLICSVHGNYSVRESLIKKGFKLKGERIIFENNRFYEGIYVSKSEGKKIVNTGSIMWDWSDPDHHEYWQRVVGHYRQKAKTDPIQCQPIVQSYETLLTSISNF